MSKRITQETFDAAVRENMEEFEMDAAGALNDAVKQFQSQGVRLDNIVQDATQIRGCGDGAETKQPVIEAIEQLKQGLDVDDEIQIKRSCSLIETECDIDLPHRCLAGANKAYDVLFDCCKKFYDARNDESIVVCLRTLNSLLNGQPDLIDGQGVIFFAKLLDSRMDDREIVLNVIAFIRKTCTMHEENRQGFVGQHIIQSLMTVLSEYRARDGDIVKEVCLMLQTLTLDDDVRVPFGRAHEHAKLIVTETNALKMLLEISRDYSSNNAVQGELFKTLGKLSVRNEFCQEIMDLGGIEFVLKALENNLNSQSIVHQIMCLLKALAGNDNVKVAIVKRDGFALILTALTKHMAHAAICEMCCICIAVIILRQPDLCHRFFAEGGPSLVLQAMKVHRTSVPVQKQGCMAIRNLVSRTKEYINPLLELGAEEIIRWSYTQHTACKDEAKAALRDLGCNVELKELWTGEKTKMSR
ncbi:armadillo repeat-containing protein 6-like [Tubulanus polymorphus]|uniref:armadillo repeat-containing protein 6-like n=1 Tax=Tubulanus polymorphus TaxID=672921 RepID=UPI003DA3151B